MNTQTMAEAIYIEVYGHIDSKTHRVSLTSEIADWLEDGDITPGTTIAELASEWLEYEPTE